MIWVRLRHPRRVEAWVSNVGNWCLAWPDIVLMTPLKNNVLRALGARAQLLGVRRAGLDCGGVQLAGGRLAVRFR